MSKFDDLERDKLIDIAEASDVEIPRLRAEVAHLRSALKICREMLRFLRVYSGHDHEMRNKMLDQQVRWIDLVLNETAPLDEAPSPCPAT